MTLVNPYIVQIYVDAAKVLEGKVADGVCALDGEEVAVPGGREPGVSVEVSPIVRSRGVDGGKHLTRPR